MTVSYTEQGAVLEMTSLKGTKVSVNVSKGVLTINNVGTFAFTANSGRVSPTERAYVLLFNDGDKPSRMRIRERDFNDLIDLQLEVR